MKTPNQVRKKPAAKGSWLNFNPQLILGWGKQTNISMTGLLNNSQWL